MEVREAGRVRLVRREQEEKADFPIIVQMASEPVDLVNDYR